MATSMGSIGLPLSQVAAGAAGGFFFSPPADTCHDLFAASSFSMMPNLINIGAGNLVTSVSERGFPALYFETPQEAMAAIQDQRYQRRIQNLREIAPGLRAVFEVPIKHAWPQAVEAYRELAPFLPPGELRLGIRSLFDLYIKYMERFCTGRPSNNIVTCYKIVARYLDKIATLEEARRMRDLFFHEKDSVRWAASQAYRELAIEGFRRKLTKQEMLEELSKSAIATRQSRGGVLLVDILPQQLVLREAKEWRSIMRGDSEAAKHAEAFYEELALKGKLPPEELKKGGESLRKSGRFHSNSWTIRVYGYIALAGKFPQSELIKGARALSELFVEDQNPCDPPAIGIYKDLVRADLLPLSELRRGRRAFLATLTVLRERYNPCPFERTISNALRIIDEKIAAHKKPSKKRRS